MLRVYGAITMVKTPPRPGGGPAGFPTRGQRIAAFRGFPLWPPRINKQTGSGPPASPSRSDLRDMVNAGAGGWAPQGANSLLLANPLPLVRHCRFWGTSPSPAFMSLRRELLNGTPGCFGVNPRRLVAYGSTQNAQ
ncbi:MAG: hypothetical protein CM15mP84_00020 [Cellvibrionales bacterium]|nr:MAG: hypothetical protein CM15mP84_00020 [Cellvibrionales bacterium]